MATALPEPQFDVSADSLGTVTVQQGSMATGIWVESSRGMRFIAAAELAWLIEHKRQPIITPCEVTR